MRRAIDPSPPRGAAVGRRRGGVSPGLLALLVAAAAVACADGREAEVDDRPIGTEIGHRAPPLVGSDAASGAWELEPRGDATLVVFFRGYRCGLCRERLRELQANLNEYERAGARLVAATADDEEGVRRMVDELGLGFRVVRVDTATLGSWGVGPASEGLPLPGSYLLDRDGVVVYRHVGRNAADRAHDLEILAALRHARDG